MRIIIPKPITTPWLVLERCRGVILAAIILNITIVKIIKGSYQSTSEQYFILIYLISMPLIYTYTSFNRVKFINQVLFARNSTLQQLYLFCIASITSTMLSFILSE